MPSLPFALRARLWLLGPTIHWKRWCRRDFHLWQVPKAFSLQKHKEPYATVAMIPAGGLQRAFPLALAPSSWCGKRMGNEHNSDCSLLCCRAKLALSPYLWRTGCCDSVGCNERPSGTANSLKMPVTRKDTRGEKLLCYTWLYPIEDTIRRQPRSWELRFRVWKEECTPNQSENELFVSQ